MTSVATASPSNQLIAESLVDRVEALARFVAVTSDRLPEEVLAPARALVDRAGRRLSLSREHTVAALAGATGSGKSSLFNAITGQPLSTVGVRRPTTGVAHAGIWGPDNAGELLDWLGVNRRYHCTGDERLRGLVLLDLPDLDSVEGAHRVEVDRLLALVDLIVWVLDPQKYADKVLHAQYLSRFSHHRDITVVLLNQADLLRPSDVQRCLADLRGLLNADGLSGVPLFATSAVKPPVGVPVLAGSGPESISDGPLVTVLRDAVVTRQAFLHRLAGDVDVAVDGLTPFVAEKPGRRELDRDTIRRLTDALADAAGVPAVVRATSSAYRHRAIKVTGWPATKWLRRLRPDPLARLHLGSAPTSASVSSAAPIAARVRSASASSSAALSSNPATAVSIPGPAAIGAAVGLALRAVADRAAQGLSEPWPAVIRTAARSRAGDLTDALDLAITRTDLGMSRRPWWWRGVGVLQWLVTLVALAGLLWLGVRLVLFAIGLPDLVDAPMVGRLQMPTAMFLGGLVAGLLVSIVVRPFVAVGARRAGRRVASRLRRAVEQAGAELVVAPVHEARQAYVEANTALTRARHAR